MITDVLDAIGTKRDGGPLSGEQIRRFVEGYTAGTVGDAQAAALCMAIVWRGMEPAELAEWTRAMIDSGERLDLSGIGRPAVDKHSTGGVGDKVSLVLVPLLAACGAAVPHLAGRGLGHTGGTLDKLGAITGWEASLPADRIVEQLRRLAGVICAPTAALCPADRDLYALRDITGTVASVPLIASSIIAKKVAGGAGALVLDVKVGSGAFLPQPDRARLLAETMVALGRAHGVRTVALLTDMERPLGRACGNAVEVAEAVEVLRGGGPPDVVEVTLALAREMVALAGLDADPAAILADGRALAAWDAMVGAQGGDPHADLPMSLRRHVVQAPETGYLRRIDARSVGLAVRRLGAGRSHRDDPVSPTAGAVCVREPGERVEAGEPIVELHVDDPGRLDGAVAALAGAIEIGPEPPPPRRLVLDRVG